MAFGPQPEIELAEGPGTWNKAFGSNVFTLENTASGTFDRYVLQIWDKTETELIAEVRQQANLAGRAHFDVARILQSQLRVHKGLELTLELADSDEETLEYYVKSGYNVQGGVSVIQNTYGPYYVTMGRKEYYEETWNTVPYISEYNAAVGGNHSITGPALALTDYTYEILKSKLTGGIPTEFNPAAYVGARVQKIRRNEDFTLSFINEADIDNGDKHLIAQIRVKSYNGNTLVDDITIDNTFSNGGGPYPNIICDPALFYQTHPYLIITTQAGPDALGLSSGITHYYVYWVPQSDTILGCLSLAPASEIYRFDIDEGECSDFDPIQVSWLNSFGFKDYFTFQKRNDQSIGITRETYDQLPGSWQSSLYRISTYDRGSTVSSQSAEETWTLRTRYLEDYEYEFLKNLFLSPDVYIRQYGDGDWKPVVIKTANWTDRTYRKNKLYQYEITVTMANKINTQRGS
jgi:hypothetical protein